MIGTHVVTCQTLYANGAMRLDEFYRGSEAECRDLLRRYAGRSSDDLHLVEGAGLAMGLAREWDE